MDSIKEAERTAGREETITNTIITMLDKNYSIEIICDITGKTKEEIISIQKSTK